MFQQTYPVLSAATADLCLSAVGSRCLLLRRKSIQVKGLPIALSWLRNKKHPFWLEYRRRLTETAVASLLARTRAGFAEEKLWNQIMET